MSQRDYRLRIAGSGDKSVEGNVDLNFDRDDIKSDGLPSSWGGQNVRPLEGSATSNRFTIEIIDRRTGDGSRQITGNLSNSDGLQDLTGRVADLSIDENPDQQEGWEIVVTGRILNIKLLSKNPAVYSIEFGDELQWIREKTVFEETVSVGGSPSDLEATTAIWPAGIRKDWSAVEGIDPIAANVQKVEDDTVVLKLPRLWDGAADEFFNNHLNGRRTTIPESVKTAIDEDAEGNIVKDQDYIRDLSSSWQSGGDFEHLRFRDLTNNTDWEVLGSRIYGKDGKIGIKKDIDNAFIENPLNDDTTVRTFTHFKLVWPTGSTPAQPSFGDEIRGYLYMPGKEPTQKVPLHLGGGAVNDSQQFTPENGLHILEYTKIVLDLVGAKYNTTQINNKIDERSELPPVFPRITSSMQAFQELRGRWKAYGFVPTLNKNGEIEIHDAIMPTADSLPDVTDLPVYNEDNVNLSAERGEHPSLEILGGTKQKTIINMVGPPTRVYRGGPFYQNEAIVGKPGIGGDFQLGADMVAVDSERTPVKRSRYVDKFGKQEMKLDFKYAMDYQSSFWRDVDNVDFLHWTPIGEAYLDRYAPGTIKTQLNAVPKTVDPGVGTFIILSLDTYPNLRDQERGGARLMQVLSNAYTKSNREVVLLDAGPEDQPLQAPSITNVTAESPYRIEVTVAGNGGGALDGDRVIIEAATGSTEPATDYAGWHPVLERGVQGSYDIGDLHADTTYWFRARQRKEGRIDSFYSNVVSATTNALSAPTNLTVERDLGCALVVSFNPAHELTTEMFVDGNKLKPVLPVGAHEKLIPNLSTGTGYTIEARHIGKHGGVGPKASLSHTTNASADTGPTPGALFMLSGEPVT